MLKIETKFDPSFPACAFSLPGTVQAVPFGRVFSTPMDKAGRTWVFDLRDPRQPHIVASFGDLDGYMHPHTYFRLPNGNVLATFQYRGGHGPKAEGGGLLEIDNGGHVLRSGSAEDGA